jgi:hypothetical protein
VKVGSKRHNKKPVFRRIGGKRTGRKNLGANTQTFIKLRVGCIKPEALLSTHPGF